MRAKTHVNTAVSAGQSPAPQIRKNRPYLFAALRPGGRFHQQDAYTRKEIGNTTKRIGKSLEFYEVDLGEYSQSSWIYSQVETIRRQISSQRAFLNLPPAAEMLIGVDYPNGIDETARIRIYKITKSEQQEAGSE